MGKPAAKVMFRLVQECLTNIHRHRGSKTAFIQLTRNDDLVCLEIRDQGQGMPPEKLVQIQSKGLGVGITGMRERVRQSEAVWRSIQTPAEPEPVSRFHSGSHLPVNPLLPYPCRFRQDG
jgi:signal transduction histidine kinase